MTDPEIPTEALAPELKRRAQFLLAEVLSFVRFFEEHEREKAIPLTDLRLVHSAVDHAACQLSRALCRKEHPEHFAKGCFRCGDKGLHPRCPECMREPVVS